MDRINQSDPFKTHYIFSCITLSKIQEYFMSKRYVISVFELTLNNKVPEASHSSPSPPSVYRKSPLFHKTIPSTASLPRTLE